MGLAIAVLADRSRFDRAAKTFIFLPMAISFVGAGIIWQFVYSYQPAVAPQIGLLNAFLGQFGIGPISWLTTEPINTIMLIVILIWAQVGFAMVILGAALKGVRRGALEAGRIDGASEWQVFRKIIVPVIWPTVITVATTIAILTLKIFDIVFAMTQGNFGTEVIASMQFKQMFVYFDYGRGSALAIILLVAVTPVIWYNLRSFRSRAVLRADRCDSLDRLPVLINCSGHRARHHLDDPDPRPVHHVIPRGECGRDVRVVDDLHQPSGRPHHQELRGSPLRRRRPGDCLPQYAGGLDPGRGHPDPHRRVRRLRVRLDEVPGQADPVHHRRRSPGRARSRSR